jgi:hypothetical protein
MECPFQSLVKAGAGRKLRCVLPKSACPRIPNQSVLNPTSSVGSQEAVLGEDNHGVSIRYGLTSSHSR